MGRQSRCQFYSPLKSNKVISIHPWLFPLIGYWKLRLKLHFPEGRRSPTSSQWSHVASALETWTADPGTLLPELCQQCNINLWCYLCCPACFPITICLQTNRTSCLSSETLKRRGAGESVSHWHGGKGSPRNEQVWQLLRKSRVKQIPKQIPGIWG